MRGLIILVSDNHMDNYFKEILAFVYNGSTVNNQPKTAEYLPVYPLTHRPIKGTSTNSVDPDQTPQNMVV